MTFLFVVSVVTDIAEIRELRDDHTTIDSTSWKVAFDGIFNFLYYSIFQNFPSKKIRLKTHWGWRGYGTTYVA
jgi:hypothetical protein